MDCTVTTGCLSLGSSGRQEPFGGLARASQAHHPPIYAALVTEWQARGRLVPGAQDAQWTAIASDPSQTRPPGGQRGSSAAPPRPGRWERAAELSSAPRSALPAQVALGPQAALVSVR
jgi:hypothetical protein